MKKETTQALMQYPISIAIAIGLTVFIRSFISLIRTFLQIPSPFTKEFWSTYYGFFEANGGVYLVIGILLFIVILFIPAKYKLKTKTIS